MAGTPRKLWHWCVWTCGIQYTPKNRNLAGTRDRGDNPLHFGVPRFKFQTNRIYIGIVATNTQSTQARAPSTSRICSQHCLYTSIWPWVKSQVISLNFTSKKKNQPQSTVNIHKYPKHEEQSRNDLFIYIFPPIIPLDSLSPSGSICGICHGVEVDWKATTRLAAHGDGPPFDGCSCGENMGNYDEHQWIVEGYYIFKQTRLMCSCMGSVGRILTDNWNKAAE